MRRRPNQLVMDVEFEELDDGWLRRIRTLACGHVRVDSLPPYKRNSRLKRGHHMLYCYDCEKDEQAIA